MSHIKSWSFSRLDVFKQCPQRAKLAYIDRIPENPRPYKGEAPNDRGTRIHKAAEDYISGKRPDLIHELKTFQAELEHVRALYPTGTVLTEEGWAFDIAWQPVPYDDFQNIWARVVTDITVFKSVHEAIVIDLKTGKRYGNEVKHGRQIQLYQLAAFMMFPKLERVTTEIWYLDKDELATQTFTSTQGRKFFRVFNQDAVEMTSATTFPVRPSQPTCRFCPFRTGQNKWLVGTGHCTANPPDPTDV